MTNAGLALLGAIFRGFSGRLESFGCSRPDGDVFFVVARLYVPFHLTPRAEFRLLCYGASRVRCARARSRPKSDDSSALRGQGSRGDGPRCNPDAERLDRLLPRSARTKRRRQEPIFATSSVKVCGVQLEHGMRTERGRKCAVPRLKVPRPRILR